MLNPDDYSHTKFEDTFDDDPPFPYGPDDYVNGYGNRSSQGQSNSAGLDVIDAGTDDWNVGPREWLLGLIFCRGCVSSIFADGGVGKTSLRYAQYLSLALGRPLTGEHVFQRCRVLIPSLEDNLDELRRTLWKRTTTALSMMWHRP